MHVPGQSQWQKHIMIPMFNAVYPILSWIKCPTVLSEGKTLEETCHTRVYNIDVFI